MNIDKLLLHPSTKNQLLSFITQPAGGLLLSGPAGSGKRTLAEYLAADLLAARPEKLENHPGLIVIEKAEAKSEIPIDAIRQLIASLSLKMATASPQAINRVAIIHNAQFLSQEAQNSLLKILEEPPARTLLVLSVDSVDNLLPTVASRTQKVSLAPPSLGDSLKHFRGRSAAAIESAWLLARGGAGLMSAILADEQNHQLKIAVAEAKRFLAAKPYQRLILLKQFEKDKTGLATFLDGLARTLSALNSQTVKQNRPASAKKVLASRQIVETAIRQLANNANSRLILLTLALDIPL